LFGVSASSAARARAPARVSPALADAAAKAEQNRELARACTDLASLRAAVASCTACELCKTRTQTVFSDGDAKARVLFIGEGPGENEDLQGVPFVGRAGQLLTDIIEKGMRLPRSQVYIANVVKCRPPGNRDPSDAEKLMCTPWLDRQVELVDPAVIVALGRHAANHVLGLEGPRALSMGALRGQIHEHRGRKVVATFHPAYLLRSPGEKKECWKDIQLAMSVLGIDPKRPSSERS
jgi:DNA polymerase